MPSNTRAAPRELASNARQHGRDANTLAEHAATSWFSSVISFSRLQLTHRVVWQPLVTFFLYSAIVQAAATQFELEEALDVGTDVTVGLITPLALILAFRLNVSYTRWWEGRLLWGSACENSRSLCTGLVALELPSALLGDEARRVWEEVTQPRVHEAAGWCLAFVTLLHHHLRAVQGKASREPAHLADLTEDHEAIEHLIGAKAFDRVAHSEHPPLLALRALRRALALLVAERRAVGSDPCVSLEAFVNERSEALHVLLQVCAGGRAGG